MYLSIETDDSVILEHLFREQLQNDVPANIRVVRKDKIYKLKFSASTSDDGSSVQPHTSA